MLYNEFEQGDILSGVRFRLALLAYRDILLCSIWSIHKIRQTPVMTRPEGNSYARMQNKAGNYLTPDGQTPSSDLSSQQVRVMTHIELGP